MSLDILSLGARGSSRPREAQLLVLTGVMETVSYRKRGRAVLCRDCWWQAPPAPPASHQQSGGWRVMAACPPHGAVRLRAPSVPMIPAPLGNESCILPLGSVGSLLQSSQGFVSSNQIHTVSLRWWWECGVLRQDPRARCLLMAAELRRVISAPFKQQRGIGAPSLGLAHRFSGLFFPSWKP